MSPLQIEQSFLVGIVAEMNALASDLPSGSPPLEGLPPGHTPVGTITDPHTKALHFMIERGVKVLQGIDADSLDLQARQKRESLPLKDEEMAIAKRRSVQVSRMTAMKFLFWASIEASVADTLALGGSRSVSIGKDWVIGHQKNEADPFADALLGSLLTGGRGLGGLRFGLIDAADLFGRP